MANILIPTLLQDLLGQSPLLSPILVLVERVAEILNDNKLPFFPDFTDHGIEHINAVLQSEVELIPKDVRQGHRVDSDRCLLCDADAAVIIGATLLHDIAMHLWPAGFLELVAPESRFQPLRWFDTNREQHMADLPWSDLWEDYLREAKRFSDSQLTNIIGEKSARSWKFDGLPAITGEWQTNHYLIIGEFIRRHHARLAHEIAIHGFPGLDVGAGVGQFPAMGSGTEDALKDLADLIGLTARSHGTSLRVCKAYLDASSQYRGMPRPRRTAVLYPMALLRVADYLQLEGQRAPAALLQLRNPQSPVSVQEWQKHRAVLQIGPADDPRARMVTVDDKLPLSLYLQLKDLLQGLQAELDHSTAVLDEVYGARTDLGLHLLSLAIRRVNSNLHNPEFRDALPYVPESTGFSADPNLLSLLVEPLYGKEPGVGVRELIQNAADAVCELEIWCRNHSKDPASLDLPEQDGDVLVDFIRREDGSWFLRVSDRGIGMRSDTIQDYFLRAGASFRQSAEWAQEFLDDNGLPKVLRAGRFGIGVFSVFLLGPSFRLWTRHASAERDGGYSVEASASAQLIEIKREGNLKIGTTIEVEITAQSVAALGLEREPAGCNSVQKQVDWFCWDWPKITKRVIRGCETKFLEQSYIAPVRKVTPIPPEWSVIRPQGFDGVFWTFGGHAGLSCNGIEVRDPTDRFSDIHCLSFRYPRQTELKAPRIAVRDMDGRLPLTTQRYGLLQKSLPFADTLERDVTLSFIAHSLTCGPESLQVAIGAGAGHPLRLKRSYGAGCEIESSLDEGRLRWCANSAGMVPVDPWLHKLLDTESCLILGYWHWTEKTALLRLDTEIILQQALSAKTSIINWNISGTFPRVEIPGFEFDPREYVANEIARATFAKLGAVDNALAVSCFDVPPSRPWKKVVRRSNDFQWFAFSRGAAATLPLESIVEALASLSKCGEGITFVAEIRTAPPAAPESLIAEIWQECLGARPIPFDPVARQQLIADASKHAELRQHIERWQAMKRSGSRWVTGGSVD